MPATFQANKKGYKRLKNEPLSTNRVAKILELTVNFSWHHISSENNPADLVSRGLSVSDLINSPLWWKGPDPSIFTNDELLENINDCEVKKEFKIPPSKILLLSSEFDLYVTISFPLLIVAAVAEWYRYRIVACLVTSSIPVPLKTRRVGQRCTLNLSRAETSSRWCGVVVRRGGCQLRCRPRHLTMVQNYVVRRQKPSCS
ncbi:uncharacterized protein TNCV_3500061 [Trichonephila clavipes]|nr:uncharacterized protein TNCV_3500061 [Trichonephila clavipes]